MNRKRITDLLELAGFGLFVAGFGLIYVPAGLIVSGALLVLGSYLAGDE